MPRLRSEVSPPSDELNGTIEDTYDGDKFVDIHHQTEFGVGIAPLSLPFFGMEGYIYKGRSHIISATPKTGKTTLIFQCLSDWVAIGEKILILSEEHVEDWGYRNRKDRLIDRPGGVIIGRDLHRFTQKELIALVGRRDETILLVDTLFAMGCLGEDENSGSKAEISLKPWIEMCRDTGKTFIGLHHNNKYGRNQLQRVSGSVKIQGAFDVIITMDRIGSSDIVVVEQQGKYGASPKLKYRRDGKQIVMAPISPTVKEAMKAKEASPLLHLPTEPPGISLEEYRTLVGERQNECLKQLTTGVASGRVIKTKSGLRGTKNLYYRKF